MQATEKKNHPEAVAAGNMAMALGNVTAPVVAVKIREAPNCHGELTALILTDNQKREAVLYDGNGPAVLVYASGKETRVLFQGIIVEVRTVSVGETCMVEVRAVTASYRMDMEKYNLSYQDTAMTFHQMVEMLVKLADGQALLSAADRPLGQIAVQYQETFWTFLKRLASWQGVFVYADSTAAGLRLWVGLPENHRETDWDRLPYTVMRDAAPVDTKRELRGQVSYQITSYDILPLGAGVTFLGRELYIGAVERRLENGLLVNTYRLYFREGLQTRRYHNPLLCGVSLRGVVEEIKRSKVTVRLETDALDTYQQKYEYPFSTVAASPDGSGWYCMPKSGDPVRIFFPESDEKEGYAISNIQGECAPSPGSPMSNPDQKDITTPDGNSVQFTGDGIVLTVAGGKGAVTLTEDGKAEVGSAQDILIGAAAQIQAQTEGELELSAGEEVMFQSDDGGSVSVKGDTIEVNAALIFNNC